MNVECVRELQLMKSEQDSFDRESNLLKANFAKYLQNNKSDLEQCAKNFGNEPMLALRKKKTLKERWSNFINRIKVVF